MSEMENRFSVRVVLGGVITLMGVILALDVLEVLDAGLIFNFWPVGMIALGFALLARVRNGGPWFPGALLILIGATFLLEEFGVIQAGISTLWPIIVILVGIAIMSRGFRPRESAGEEPSEDTLSRFAMLSGYSPNVSSQNFRGGDLSAFLGGMEIDLRRADIGTQPAVLDLFVLMGGIEIKVPPNWTVEARITPFMGGMSDSADRSEADPDKHLVVKGFVMMGGVEITN